LTLESLQKKCEAERNACAEAQARAVAEYKQAKLVVGREEAVRAERLASEAKCQAEKSSYESAAAQAAAQRQAAEIAEAKAREAIALAKIEGERAAAEQRELAAIQEKVKVEELACHEAEQRAAAQREANRLSRQRLQTEVAAREAEQARVEAERLALAAAQEKRQIEELAAREKEASRSKSEQELSEAELAARELIQRMSQKAADSQDWRERAEAILAESPTPVAFPRARRAKRPMVAALVMMVTVAAALGGASWNGVGPFARASAAVVASPATVPVVAATASANKESIGSPDLHLSFALAAAPAAAEKDE
jgi:hypothetical protein